MSNRKCKLKKTAYQITQENKWYNYNNTNNQKTRLQMLEEVAETHTRGGGGLQSTSVSEKMERTGCGSRAFLTFVFIKRGEFSE
jgi:hypothetical protein